MTEQDPKKELKNTLAQIEKTFGKGAIMQLGEHPMQEIRGISTGALSLDIALGGKGLPRGRIIEIFGPEASGKTTVALHAVAEAQKQGGVAAFIDVEHALDPGWAKRLGVDLESLLVSQPSNAEEALTIAEMLVKSGAVDIIVIDSVAALVPKSEVEGEIGEPQMGVQARLMSQSLRKLNPTIAKTNTCLIFINQLRQKIGIVFGNPETTSGGQALKYYASVRLDIRKVAPIKDKEEVIGAHIRVKVVKNKVAPPFQQAEFDLMHDQGISREGDVLELGVEAEIIQRSGGYHSYGELRLGNSREKAKEYLRENPALLEEIRGKILESRGLVGTLIAPPPGADEAEEEAPPEEVAEATEATETTPETPRRRRSSSSASAES
jgi:recombination protein RecA